MKFKNIIIVAILVVASIFVVSCGRKSSSAKGDVDVINYLTTGDGDWAIKVDEIQIPSSAFNRDLKAFMKINSQPDDQIALALNDNNTKQAYAEKLVSDILLLEKAQEDAFFDNEETQAIINSALRNIKVQYYTQQLMQEAAMNIPDPTEAQAKAFFDQAGPQLAQYGITNFTTQTRPAINQLYKLAFAEQAVQRQLVDLKDKSIIQRNSDVLGSPSLVPTQQGLNPNQDAGQEILPRGN